MVKKSERDDLEIIVPEKSTRGAHQQGGIREDVSRLPVTKGTSSFFPANTSTHTYGHKKYKSKASRALFDFWEFIDLIGIHGGNKAFDQVFHKEMVDFVSQTQSYDIRNRRRLGLVARGHAKSTLGTVAYSLWRIYRNPNIRICMATATKPLALQFVKSVKQYLEDPRLQDEVWNNRPHINGRMIPILDRAGASRRNQRWDLGEYTEAEDKKIVWRSDALQVIRTQDYTGVKEPTLLAASPGSNITGMHFDLIILDDIINEDTVATPEKRDKTLRWARDLESVVDPENSVELAPRMKEIIGDEVVVWGTRYHLEDYYQHLLDNLEDFNFQLFYRNVYKNGKDASDGFLWPARFNEKKISLTKKIQGVVIFSAQYLNKVVPTEEIIFDTEKVKYLSLSAVQPHPDRRGFVRVTRKNPHDDKVETIALRPFAVIDPAISTKKTADYSVTMVGGVDVDRSLYILDFRYGRWLPHDLIRNTFDLLDKYGMKAVHIETVGYQLALIHMFKAAFKKYHPISLIQYKPQGKKEDRVKYHLQPIFDNDQIYLMGWMKNCQELMDELNYFPTTHDDIVDAMSMIVEVSSPTKKDKKKSIYGTMDNVIRGRFTLNKRYGGRLR